MRPSFSLQALPLLLALAAGCGSSPSKTQPTPDAASLDASRAPDAALDTLVKTDLMRIVDAKVVDSAMTPDAQVPEVAIDTNAGHTPDAFLPGPVERLLVNSGNTAKYDLADGTWKVFSFETLPGHFYCLGALAEGVDAYLGFSPTVSPTDYNQKTNYLRALNFTAQSGGTYYLALAATGGAASGTFQISDGGDLLEVAENTVNLTATGGDSTRFFYFTVAPGHSYAVSLAGTAKSPVSLGLSPLADRSASGAFAFPYSTKTSVLPITDEPVPLESVAKSSSRLYFISVTVKETVSLTIKIDLAS